ncbi:lysylphosphatidylglycerol synthase transmembrane domain-containing protein [Paenibacillus sp. FSL L8-0506]|uniref:lysylphosphatidylglycerol synthase transmembrane domain-containing protein n=1 Tax=Paenibacillus sp. FSL L8-0506 TaxID=2975335 RepID=UPI0030F4D1B1
MNRKRLLYVVLGTVVSLILLVYVENNFSNVNYYYFIIGILVYSLVLLLRSFKLNKIMRVYTNISFKETVSLTASSQLMGAFIPGRAGEILVSAYLKLKYTVDISKVLPILFLDKIIELLCVLLYSIFAVFVISEGLLSFLNDSIKGIRDNYLLISIVIVFVFLLLLIMYKILGPKLKNVLSNIKQSLLIPIKNPKLGIIIIATSLLTIISEYFYLYFIFHAFNIEITIAKVILVHSLGMIVGVLSMIPGGQGSTEVTMLAVLHFWGYTTLTVITPILASKFLTYFILALYGLPLLPYSVSVLKERKKRSRKKMSNE